MKGWITLTHMYSGDKFHVRHNTIHCLRENDQGRVLIMFNKNEGSYVNESVAEIFTLIELDERGDLYENN